MSSSESLSLTVRCSHCKKDITEQDRNTSVLIRVWSPKVGRYIGHGPLHAECGKAFNQIVNKTGAAR